MNWEVLLHWLTHLGEGSWAAFRRTLLELAGPDLDADVASRRARVRLSDLAHVDFFVGGGRRWQVLAPLLGGLANDPAVAVLCGGRTPRLVEDVATAGAKVGCAMDLLDVGDGPRQVRLEGGQEATAAVGAAVGLSYVPNIAAALCWSLEPIQTMLQNAVAEPSPINWTVRSFDLDGLAWTDRVLPRTAYEYSSRHGERRHYVRGSGRRGLLRMDRRAAVYAAALLNSVSLAHYDAAARRLSTPVDAPLPAAYSRIATLCSGRLSVVKEGRRIYEGVPPETAGVLLVAVGQSPPQPCWFSAGKGRS